MKTTTLEETTEILKRLSPKNQAYLMTLMRVADNAEKNVNEAAVTKPRKASKNETT